MTLGIDKAVEARKVPSEGWPVAPSIDPGSFLYASLHMALSRRLVPDFHWNLEGGLLMGYSQHRFHLTAMWLFSVQSPERVSPKSTRLSQADLTLGMERLFRADV
jgi:hypothetical protein